MRAISMVELLLAEMYCTARTDFLVIEASLRRLFVGQARTTAITPVSVAIDTRRAARPKHQTTRRALAGYITVYAHPGKAKP